MRRKVNWNFDTFKLTIFKEKMEQRLWCAKKELIFSLKIVNLKLSKFQFTSQILKTRAKGTDCFEVAVNPDMCQSAIIGSHNL